MRFFTYLYNGEIDKFFYQKPKSFNRYSRRELLAYGLGATLYMPATRPGIHQDILSNKHEGLTSIVIDLEDAVADGEVGKAEELFIGEMLNLYSEVHKGFLQIEDLPLLFFRVRGLEQFIKIIEQLGEAIKLLTGVVAPKFSPEMGSSLIELIQKIHTGQNPFYLMPILETKNIIQKETRIDELLRIKQLVDSSKENILNIRIGATDFSGLYGIRRNADTTVYDIAVVRDCISDIVNVFGRSDSPYVISGPVWEYFSPKERMLKPQLRETPFRERFGTEGLKIRADLIDHNIDGLIKEVLMDITNGLTGKTIIHPSHIKVVQSLNVVSYEEYIDAQNILAATDSGVLKSSFANKMNEIKPHYYWAQKIMLKSRIYGVLNEEFTNIDLIKQQVYV